MEYNKPAQSGTPTLPISAFKNYYGAPLNSVMLGDISKEKRVLYVRNVPKSATPLTMYKLVQPHGAVSSVGVIDSKMPDHEKSIYYVVLMSKEAAYEVMENLCDHVIDGVPIVISLYTALSPASFDPKANIVIHNLEPTIDGPSVFRTFSQFGTILSCNFQRTYNGERSGFAAIQFESPEAAKLSIKLANNKQVGNKIITVKLCLPPIDSHAFAENNYTEIIVFNLPENTFKEHILEEFKKIGPIESYQFQQRTPPAGTEKSPSPLFTVNYTNHDDAVAAKEKLDQTEYMGRIISISRKYTKNHITYLNCQYNEHLANTLLEIPRGELAVIINNLPLFIDVKTFIQENFQSASKTTPPMSVVIPNLVRKTNTLLIVVDSPGTALSIYDSLSGKYISPQVTSPLIVQFGLCGFSSPLTFKEFQAHCNQPMNYRPSHHSYDASYSQYIPRQQNPYNEYNLLKNTVPQHMLTSQEADHIPSTSKYPNQSGKNTISSGPRNRHQQHYLNEQTSYTKESSQHTTTSYSHIPTYSNRPSDPAEKEYSDLADLSPEEFKVAIRPRLLEVISKNFNDKDESLRVLEILLKQNLDPSEFINMIESEDALLDTIKAANCEF